MTIFALFAPDCDAYYYEDAQEALFCPSCGSYVGESHYYPDQLSIKKLEKDFSFTYDGELLLSRRAVRFLQSEADSKLHFHKVNTEPEIYVLETTETVSFDSDKRKTSFVNPCSLCGNFESIVGATPVFLKNEGDVGSLSLASTDLKFGSSREKSPLHIVGEGLGRKLEKTFKEIDLVEVRQ